MKAATAIATRRGGGQKTRLLAGTLAVLVATAPAWGQSGISTARDAETERLLADYIAPLIKTAGWSTPEVNLVNARDFNAFVIPGNRLFIYAGAIIDSEAPNEVIGVLAHEIAHLAANDTARIQEVIQDTSSVMLLAGLLSIGAAAAGSAAGSEVAARAGSSVFSAIGEVGQRFVLRYKRDQEAAADLAALRYLDATGQSARGMISTLSRLTNDSLFTARSANPYLQSHPFPRERAITVETLARKSRHFEKLDSRTLQARHNLVRAKLVGFTRPQGEVYRIYPRSDQSLPGRYARAISEYRSGRRQEAMRLIDQLIAAVPKYPYFHELKGQALFETGNARAAIGPLRKAVALSGNDGLINVLLGQALVAAGDRASADQAVEALRLGLRDAPRSVSGFRALARAYAIQENIPMAQLTTAQRLVIEGNLREAKAQAKRAKAGLKPGSPAWNRADDILFDTSTDTR
ncbi:MAG: M48 family metalloprotease [Alphaproteobacteria bacterium]